MGFKKVTAGTVLALFTALAAGGLSAQGAQVPAPEPEAPKTSAASAATGTQNRANGVYLAYLQTSSALENNTSRRGIEALAIALKARTSVAPAGAVAVNPERDEIALFPFIYWPVISSPSPLPERTREKVQSYLDNGGFIVFDVRNKAVLARDTARVPELLGLKVNPLSALNKEHTLTKAFYLVSDHLPGSSDYDTVFVETPGPAGAESISVVVGQNNWAGAWAGLYVPQKSKEQEMALRSGINMVMYALTGDYKADQIHVPAILKRLEKK